ncbi:MAG: Dam family site-specific DNA-(adenine-N6)-methyltransferase [Methanobacteriaceae archaeon]|nr:Dam family site-specific DNA-(adenine-N6)-methyltransferase [Methanobacteriaceae archaeon]
MKKLTIKNQLFPRPFLKWAGGKNQLLKEFKKRLPLHIVRYKRVYKYVEPFLGGGAMFFFLKRNFEVKESFLFDINPDLIMAYKVIQNNQKELLDHLEDIESRHLKMNEKNRKKHYYLIRTIYNQQMKNFDYDNPGEEWVERTSYFIFLNKTCYNGLFRLNKKGEFNVPYGKYDNPKIYNKENIIQINKALRDTEIFQGDFTESEYFIDEKTLVYLDPPYRPLSNTSNFTNYAKNGFSDSNQLILAKFFFKMDKKGAYLILSNSDPKNKNPDDKFFDDLYKNYIIERIPAKRNINRDRLKRGQINELIIRNFK